MICPSCGGEAKKKVCPYCGTKLTEGSDPDRSTHDQGGGTPHSGDEPWAIPERLKKDQREFIPAKAELETPRTFFLRKLAGSPLILLSAVLMLLYMGFVCYTLGDSGIWILRRLSDGSNFDSAFSLIKIAYISALAVCLGKIILTVWLTVSLWSLYCGAIAGRKAGLSHNAVNSLQRYCHTCVRLYRLLTGAALLTLVYALADKLIDRSTLPQILQDVCFGVDNLVCTVASVAERDHLARYLSEEPIVLAGIVSLAFFMRLLRCSMLQKFLAQSSYMLRFGDGSHQRYDMLALLTLLGGLATMANGAARILLKDPSGDKALLYGPSFLYGLVFVLGALVLHWHNTGRRKV